MQIVNLTFCKSSVMITMRCFHTKLNSLSHENLKTIKAEEDVSHFYPVTECFSSLEKIDNGMFEYGSD